MSLPNSRVRTNRTMKKILLVDDKVTIGRVLKIYLGTEYDLEYFEDPLKALEWLNVNSGSRVSNSASRMIESWLRICSTRPWWKVRAQNEHSPKQPRLELMENLISAKAGTPPAAS